MAQHLVGAGQEGIAVAGFAQGLRGHRAHLPGREALQALGKAGQAGQAALSGIFGQQALGIQAGTQAHGFLQIIDALVAAFAQLGDLQPEAVGAHVDRGQQMRPFTGFEGERGGSHRLGGGVRVHIDHCLRNV